MLGYTAPKVSLDSGTAIKVLATFGGGMWCGRTCGVISGALMALGMKYGYSEPNISEQKNTLLAKKAEFEQKFAAVHGSVLCKDILGGLNLGKPEDMAEIMEKNLLFTLCPKVICTVCKILDEMM